MLDQWALTLSSKDGCFQAHLLVVHAWKLLFPLRYCLGTLTDDLGCFPFDKRPLHLLSVCSKWWCNESLHTQRCSEFHWSRLSFGPPSSIECSTPLISFERSTSIDFAENQLSLSLFSLSLLPKSHPRILQHTWVRSSNGLPANLQPALG